MGIAPRTAAETPDRSFARDALAYILILLVLGLPLLVLPPAYDLYDMTKRAFAQVLAACALWMALGACARPGRWIARPLPFLGAALAAIGLAAPSVLAAISPRSTIDELWLRLLWVGLAWSAAQIGGDRVARKRIVGFALIGGTAACVMGLAQAGGRHFDWLPEVASPASFFGNKNMAAEYVLLLLPFFAWMIGRGNAIVAWAATAGLALDAAYLVAAYTRATWVAAGVTGVLYLGLRWHAFREGPVARRLGLGRLERAAGTALVLALVVVVPPVARRIAASMSTPAIVPAAAAARTEPEAPGIALGLGGFSTNWRLVVWANSLVMARDHPVVGVGLANWRLAYPLYCRAIAPDKDFNARVQADCPHNDFVQTLAETGVVGTAGLGLLIVALLAWLRSALAGAPDEESRGLAVAAFTALVAGAIDAMFSFPAEKAAPTSLLWLMLGLAAGACARREEGPSPLGRTWPIHVGASLIVVIAVGQAIALLAGEVRFKQALLTYNDGHMEQSLDLLKRARWWRPDLVAIPLFESGVEMTLGDHKTAEASARAAIALHPNFTNAHNELGLALWRQGNVGAAREEMERALRIFPEFHEALRNLASLEIQQGSGSGSPEVLRTRMDHARELLEKLTADAEHDPVDVLDLADVYRRLGRLDRARERYQSFLDASPNDVRALSGLAHTERMAGHNKQAESLYLRALAQNPSDPILDAYLAIVERAQGREAQARERERAIIQRAPDFYQARIDLAQSLERSHETTQAHEVLETGLARVPTASTLMMALSDIETAGGRWAQAALWMGRALAIDPHRSILWGRLSALRLRAHDRAGAIQALEDGLAHDPGSAELLNERGRLLMETDLPAALAQLEKAALVPGAPAEVFFNLGRTYTALHKREEALAAYRRFVEIWRGDPRFMGEALAAIKRLESPDPFPTVSPAPAAPGAAAPVIAPTAPNASATPGTPRASATPTAPSAGR